MRAVDKGAAWAYEKGECEQAGEVRVTALGSLYRVVAVLALMVLAACGTSPEARAPASPDEVARLEAAILALGPEVDPEEARRAAQLSYDTTRRLAIEYQITDGPLVHNTKVNLGLRPRGLCWHWAEDMQKALVAEDFQTLDIHRAIANADNPFLLEHSTALISARGDDMFDAIVVDPWRLGGELTWIATRADTDYNWRPQREVLAEKRRRLLEEIEIAPPSAGR
jgi:hypothetical protein